MWLLYKHILCCVMWDYHVVVNEEWSSQGSSRRLLRKWRLYAPSKRMKLPIDTALYPRRILSYALWWFWGCLWFVVHQMKRLVAAVLVIFFSLCPLSKMVAHVVKKFLASVQVLSTMYFQILVHLDPIYSILKWKQHVPHEGLYHPTALHGVQTQKATMWINPLKSSLFWGVTQR